MIINTETMAQARETTATLITKTEDERNRKSSFSTDVCGFICKKILPYLV